MISAILNGIVNFVFHLINSFLAPIDIFINNHFPIISSGLQAINQLLTFILGYIGYCVDASGLHPVAIGLIVAYFSFSIIATFTSHVIKVVIKWWGALVP